MLLSIQKIYASVLDWVLHKDENDIITVAKAELTDDFQVDITLLDRDISPSSATAFSPDYWDEPSIWDKPFFPERLPIM